MSLGVQPLSFGSVASPGFGARGGAQVEAPKAPNWIFISKWWVLVHSG